jgi:hypothetical protein
MENVEFAKALASLPLTAILVLVLVGGYMGWWIYGSVHRDQVEDLMRQIISGNTRADKWETRFLELNSKLDSMLRETSKISRTVDGTAQVAQTKLNTVEDKLEAVRQELITAKENARS